MAAVRSAFARSSMSNTKVGHRSRGSRVCIGTKQTALKQYFIVATGTSEEGNIQKCFAQR